MDSSVETGRAWHSRERPGGHHWRAEVADLNLAEVNDFALMFCIQTRALDNFNDKVASAKDADHYPSLRAGHVSTCKA